LAVGCDNGTEWVGVTDLAQVDGTWKTSGEVTTVNSATLTTVVKTDITLLIKVGAATMKTTTVTKTSYTGTDVTDAWWLDKKNSTIQAAVAAGTLSQYEFDDAGRSFTRTQAPAAASIKLSTFDGNLLSPDGKQLLRSNRVYTKM